MKIDVKVECDVNDMVVLVDYDTSIHPTIIDSTMLNGKYLHTIDGYTINTENGEIFKVGHLTKCRLVEVWKMTSSDTFTRVMHVPF